ncbi:MAG: Hsp20/alpha crystallin family protein [Acholeplasmatales bacterium]|nr:Hsp20/alpha crystallin family protein [Acholeplasmatales bacterium]
MYNLESKKNNNYLSLFDEFDDFFTDKLGKDMKTNILENGDNYTVTSEIPGVSKENIKIDVADNTLTISVNKKNTNKDEKKNYLVKEISETSLSRSFYLDDMDENNITAKMDNGILTITVGKIKEVKPQTKRITIE